MQRDLRCRHDISIRRMAAEMADAGMGWDSISSALALPRGTVKQWVMTYRAVGMDGLLNMGSKKKTYDYETRLAAARACGRRTHVAGRDGRLRDCEPRAGAEMVQAVPGGRRRGPEAEAQRQAARIAREAGPQNARARARGARPEARG